MFDETGCYAFRFLDDICNPPVQLSSIGVEERCSESYCWHNEKRRVRYLFQYTLSGSGCYFDGQTEHEIKPASAFFISLPGPTAYYYRTNGAPWRFVFVLLCGNSVEEYYQKIVAEHTCILNFNNSSPSIRKLDNIWKMTVCGKMDNPFSAASAAMDFLTSLCLEGKNNLSGYPDLIRKAIQLMETDFPILDSVEQVASLLQVTPSHLCREFTRYTGYSPVHYLTRLRLQYGANLLTQTNQRIEDIALACGFSNGNYFAKVFKRYLGTNPGDFRNSRETGNHIIKL